MNFPLLAAVAQSDLPPLQRLILVMLLNHADKHGRAWPSHATLARETGMTERSVGSHMRNLEKMGWLARRGTVGRVGMFTVCHPATATAESRPASAPSENHSALPESPAPFSRKMVPAELTPMRNDFPGHPEGVSGHPENGSASSGKSFRQTTQEPIINHPENHPIKEEGRPPPDFAGGPSSQNKKVSSSSPNKPGWREWHKKQADEANAVAPPPHPPREFLEAWGRYRDYRTQRATAARVSSEAVAWTANAAAAALRSCERHAQAHGWTAVAAQIDTAIGGNWQGLHFPTGPARAGPRAVGGRATTYQVETATQGHTDEEINNFMPLHLCLERLKQ